MAKTATKFAPRRIRSNEERETARGSFITLKRTNDFFEGYALFIPDPEVEDNPGWYEYFEHYTPATGYCPCAGDECPLCQEGDSPSTRAKTLWLVDGQVKVFTLNYYVIQEFVDMKSEGDAVQGQLFKIKRLEGNGKYSIRNRNEKLTKTELKSAMKDVDDDMLEKIATKQMRRVLEEIGSAEALEEDDDDATPEDEDDKPKAKGKAASGSKAKKGKPAEDEPEGDDFDPEEADDAEDLTVTVVKAKKKDNILVVTAGESDEFEIYGTDEADLTEYAKGADLVVSIVKDSDGDFVVSEVAEAEEEAEGGDGDTPESYDAVIVTITSINDEEDTLTVEDESGNSFDLYFLDDGEDDEGRDWKELDLSDYEEGQEVTISAALDPDGDMLASTFPEPVKAKGKSKAKGGKSKGKKKAKG